MHVPLHQQTMACKTCIGYIAAAPWCLLLVSADGVACMFQLTPLTTPPLAVARCLTHCCCCCRAAYDKVVVELGIRSVIAGDSHKAAQRAAAESAQ
jgi:hypothetical protein